MSMFACLGFNIDSARPTTSSLDLERAGYSGRLSQDFHLAHLSQKARGSLEWDHDSSMIPLLLYCPILYLGGKARDVKRTADESSAPFSS